MNTFQLISLKGSYFDIGFQHGKSCSELINGFSKNLFDVINKEYSLSMDQIFAEMKPYVDYSNQYAPHLLEEIKGIAEGSGISFEEAFFLNTRGEFTYARQGCTSFAIPKALSADNQVMVAQNVDLGPQFEDLGVILHIVPDQGPEIITWTIAGCVGQTGINSYGLARCGNGLHGKGIEPGLPAQLGFRLLLEQESVDSALALFTDLKRTKASNYLIGDASGKVVNIEASASAFRVSEIGDKFLCHTNHFVATELMVFEIRPEHLMKNSVLRLQRIMELLVQQKEVSEEDGLGFLRDHKYFPDSVCNHPEEGVRSTKTIASILTKPGEGKLFICKGNPCENRYEVYSFK